jgi:hypothetical protein
MAELVLSIRILVAEVHAARLIVSEVGATGDLKVGALSRCPDLQIVGPA